MGTIREPCKLRTRGLGVRYGNKPALRKIDLEIAEHRVTAVIGPSGCGKSTLLRCFNRMHDLDPNASYEGEAILLPSGIDLLAPDVDPVEVRMRVGMVFQKPNPFPKSIFENVVFGLRVQGRRSRAELEEAAERSLRLAGLWNEVRDRLHEPATALSGGQQQRVCIARALATEPEVLLLDEPTSALDPIGTAAIEDLIGELKSEVTIVIVTHSMQQAARVSDYAAFLYLGELIEFDRTERLFVNPARKETQDYITGRFG